MWPFWVRTGDYPRKLVRGIKLQLQQHAEAVPQGACYLPSARGSAHQREARQVDADALRRGALAYHDVQRIILQRGVQHLFHLAGKAVYLVDEQHVALLQVRQQRGQIARLFNGRAGCDADLHAHLVRHNAR